MRTFISTLLMIVIVSATAYAEIDGVLGLSEVEPDAALAVWFPLAQDQAVTAVRWYNNDGTTVFPELMLTAGQPEEPGWLGDATAVHLALQGGSDQWARCALTDPVASSVDGLYVVFRLPQGSVPISRGEGGGVAVGYEMKENGRLAWLTPDGENWVALSRDVDMAVEIETAPAVPSTVRLERGAGKNLGLEAAAADAPVLIDAFLKPSPNPFNPKTQLQFSLKEAGPVSLEIYDLMGRQVSVPVRARYAAGPHQVEWTARDERGRELASGVYLARLKLNGFEGTQRLVLVR
ncbi:MAG TPA: T9SS type A sorting domain-containing protein [Candidatus Krumholzibacteria bacterium]|nr:T9SS type A sorting domain-containing protein [Candidatus Krumholzibacteria bacterium]